MMKRLICLALTLFVVAIMKSQILFEVTYHAPVDSQMVYLLNAENLQIIDSALIENNQVYFRGVAPEPLVAIISPAPRFHGDMSTFVLDNQPLTLSRDSLGILKVKGSTINQRYADYTNVITQAGMGLQSLQMEYMKLLKEHNNIVPDSMMIRIENMYDQIAQNIDRAHRTLVEKNSDNLIPLFTLLYHTEDLGYDFVDNYLKDYKYADRECLASVKATILKERCKMPGSKVINLVMPDVSGRMRELTDYVGKGKYVLVDFWASWCGPCRKEMPNIRKAYDKYHDKGFDIVSISLDSNHEAWAKSIKNMGMKWHQMSDLKGWESKGAELYNIRSIPATILYAPDGTVVQSNLRGVKLLDRLAEIFGN